MGATKSWGSFEWVDCQNQLLEVQPDLRHRGRRLAGMGLRLYLSKSKLGSRAGHCSSIGNIPSLSIRRSPIRWIARDRFAMILSQREALRILNPTNLLKTIAFAADKHRQQRRKDTEASPYINHPIAVATVLAAEGDVYDEMTLLAAVLHDTVEDTQTTFVELEEHFGLEVAGLVRELTDDKSLDKGERKRLQIEHARESSIRAKQVKIADKICNVRDITFSPPADWSLERRREYFTWSEKVVAGCRDVNPKLDQAFDRTIARARDVLALKP
jgi:GTP diphosphokinase / guanosine-3',5'-bis(diphosphate) 3'-diphosphatase